MKRDPIDIHEILDRVDKYGLTNAVREIDPKRIDDPDLRFLWRELRSLQERCEGFQLDIAEKLEQARKRIATV